MKKALVILITVCLLASLFVSCDNNARIDELVSVSFDAADTRSLVVSNEAFIDFDSEAIEWQYKATKDTDDTYNVGAAATWTPIPGRTPGKITNVVEFSQGKWNFELRAIKKNVTPEVVVYYGKTDTANPVLLTKQEGVSVFNIPINLTAQLSEQKGYIVLSNISVKHLSNGTETLDAPNKVIIDEGKGINEKVFTLGTSSEIESVTTSNGTALKTTGADGYKADVGTHTVKVQKIGENEEILAEEEKTVEVYAGLKTTVSNWIVEITQAGQFAPQLKGTKTVTIPTTGDAVVVFVNVTPSMEADKSTTVTIPSAVVSSATSAVTLDIVVKDYRSVADHSFNVAPGKGVAASISLTMKDGDTVKTNFDSNKVTVETYIGTGLSGVTVKYNGDGDAPSDIEYVPATGKLTFKTTHFSEFYVEADKQAKIENKGYVTLQGAIDAISVSTESTVIEILSNINLTTTATISGKGPIEIKLNGKVITGIETRALLVEDGEVSITGPGTITVSQGIKESSSVIRVAGTDAREAKLTIGDDVTISSDYSYGITVFGPNKQTLIVNGSVKTKDVPAISGNGSSDYGETDITINGSVEALNENAIYHPQAGKLTINGTVKGLGGIETKSGTTVSLGENARVEATATSVSHHPNSNGCSTSGYAIVAVENSAYKGNPKFSISGGTYIGEIAVITDNTVKDSKKASINITGGTFSTDPSAYVDFGYKVEQNDDKYVVSLVTDDIPIYNAKQLMQFAASVNDGNDGNDYAGTTITLNRDIDLEGKTWVPIGEGNRSNRQHVFKGIFDGNNHTIKNLSSNGYDPSTVAVNYKGDMIYAYGLFGIVEGATIQNVKFENISIDTAITVNDTPYKGDSVGAVVGYAFKNVTITGCEVSNGSIKGHDAVAGIVGRAYGENKESDKFEISNCKNYATIQATKGKVAGVIGITGNLDNSRYSSIIQNCENRGTITGNEAGTAGIIAYVNKNTTINSCHNYGVIGSSNDQYSGGIAGYVTKGGNINISGCINEGTVSASLNAGGIVGISTDISSIINCENSGSISAGDNGHAGGIAGSTKFSNVTDCKNTATVHGMYSGGIIGVDGASTITNSTGGSAAITSPAHTIGYNTNNHYQLEVAANKSSGRLIGGLGGDGPNAFTKLTISANESDEKLPAVGICGIYTTWSNLEITGGNFYGEPLAGNTSYIILTQAGSWGSLVAGTYSNGGLDENSRKTNWTLIK